MKYRKEGPEEKQHMKKLQNPNDWDNLKTIITFKKKKQYHFASKRQNYKVANPTDTFS